MDKLPTTEDRIRLTRRPEGQPVVMRQDWQQLLFLHWRVSPELVQATLPPGLTVDTFDGDAYIGLVPFTMRNVRPVGLPAVPGLSHFHEINVRTYVHANGEPGVWFYSLDAANPIAVAIARALFHLPYHWADISMPWPKSEVSSEESSTGKHGFDIRYRTSRRSSNESSDLLYEPLLWSESEDDSVLSKRPDDSQSRYAIPGTLDYFLCERYLLYAVKGSKLYAGRVHHSSYRLFDVRSKDIKDTLVAAAGFPGVSTNPPDHRVYSDGVSVEVFGLRPVVE